MADQEFSESGIFRGYQTKVYEANMPGDDPFSRAAAKTATAKTQADFSRCLEEMANGRIRLSAGGEVTKKDCEEFASMTRDGRVMMVYTPNKVTGIEYGWFEGIGVDGSNGRILRVFLPTDFSSRRSEYVRYMPKMVENLLETVRGETFEQAVNRYPKGKVDPVLVQRVPGETFNILLHEERVNNLPKELTQEQKKQFFTQDLNPWAKDFVKRPELAAFQEALVRPHIKAEDIQSKELTIHGTKYLLDEMSSDNSDALRFEPEDYEANAPTLYLYRENDSWMVKATRRIADGSSREIENAVYYKDGQHLYNLKTTTIKSQDSDIFKSKQGSNLTVINSLSNPDMNGRKITVLTTDTIGILLPTASYDCPDGGKKALLLPTDETVWLSKSLQSEIEELIATQAPDAAEKPVSFRFSANEWNRAIVEANLKKMRRKISRIGK